MRRMFCGRSATISAFDGWMRGEMRGLRQQGPQDRHELRGADVVEDDRLRHVVVAGAEARVRIGHDLDGVAGVERHEAVDLERRQEQFDRRRRATSARSTAP